MFSLFKHSYLNNIPVEKSNEPCTVLARRLNQLILKLYGKYLNETGTSVDYQGLKRDDLFQNIFLQEISQLQYTDPNILNEDEKKAFFLNLYNMMIIHGKTVENIKGNFFQNIKYKIAGHIFSCDDIEHGILRCNSKNTGIFGQKPFGEHDPRISLILKKKDPRIHFALVCGAKSCPPIRIYDEKNIHKALDLAAKHFLNSHFSVDFPSKKIFLSKILNWYAVDFGKTKEKVLNFIYPFLEEESKKDVDKIRNDLHHWSFEYEKYDWTLNSNY